MKNIGISIIKNEADIVEIFVRYHAAIFDHIFIIDHNSQDDTNAILESLRAEGLPLDIYHETVGYHNQSECMTRLMHLVKKKYDPDWIVPLDADEFLIGADFDKLQEEVSKDHRVLFPVWHNYTPTINDPRDELNVLKRLKYKNKKINYNQHKVLIPKNVISEGMYLPEGNHELYHGDGTPVSYTITTTAHIAHFPVRSVEQIQKKAFCGWPSKLANPSNKGVSPDYSQWKIFFNKLKNGSTPNIEDLQAFAVGYTTNQIPDVIDIVKQPIEITSGMELRYPPKPYLPITALADTAEMLAYNFMLSHHKGA